MNQEELDRVIEIFSFCKKLMEKKSEEYGDVWKHSNLGYKALFVDLDTKHGRLKKLIWDDDVSEKTVDRVADTLIDMLNYCVLTILLIEETRSEKMSLNKKIEMNLEEK